MKVFGFFLLLHAKRWLRFASELGFVRLVVVLIFLAMGFRFMQLRLEAGQHYFPLLVIPIVQMIQFRRKDFSLLNNLGINDTVLYMGIYLVLCAPSLLVFLVYEEWLYAAVTTAFGILIPFTKQIKADPDRWFVSMGDFLPVKYFEWRSGLRQYGLAVSALLLIGLGLSFVPYAVSLVLFFLTLNTTVFYLFGESKELLVACGKSPAHLIRQKLLGHFKLFYTMVSPLVILSVVFHHDSTSLMVLAYVSLMSFFASINAVLFKYVSYAPGARFDNNTVLQGLMLAFFLVPFLMPVPIVMAVINYRRSINNLKVYFN